MGNGASRRYNDEDVPRKVAKWRAELDHVKELNRMLSEERRIVTTSMEQELYDKQVELFYLGKTATKYIGFRGYLKIINKVSPRTQADFMTPGDYNKDKKPANQSTGMVLRSAILNFSLFALFEAWLLKRMHFVSIQKHQRRLHQKGWKNIVAFYSEEIPSIQEIFERQEPHLKERVEIGKKENMAMLEEYETKLFQQEEEIMRLRKMLEDMSMGSQGDDYMREGEESKKSGMSLDRAFPKNLGTTNAHREFNKARSPVRALMRNMETTNSMRGGMTDEGPVEKGWRTDQARTWGATNDSDNESLYTEEDKKNQEVLMMDGDRLAPSRKGDNNSVLSDKMKDQKDADTYSDAVSAITMPNAIVSGSVSTGDSLKTDEYSEGGGSGSLSSSQRKVRNKDTIRLERERLEKAKADRKRRKEKEKKERESFYKQERERLQHQEKRLNFKREKNSSRLRQERLQDVSMDGDQGEDNNLIDEFLDAVEEQMDGADENPYADTMEPVNYKDDEDEDEDDDGSGLVVRHKSKRSIGSYVDENDNDNNTEEYDDSGDEVVGLNDMDLGEGSKKHEPQFNPDKHPSMGADALLMNETSVKREKSDRRRVWHKDKADSDRDLSCDDDSIGNEIKRLEEFETEINRSESGRSSNLGDDDDIVDSFRQPYKEDTVPPDGSSLSKSNRSRKSVSKLRERFEASTEEASVYSKGSKGSKGSNSTGRKKKKVVVVRKKRKKKKPKQFEDDQSFDEDEEMTVTSALTSNSYD